MTLLNLILNKLEIESAEVFIMEVRDRIIVRVILTLSQPHVSFPPSHLFPLQHQSKRRASNNFETPLCSCLHSWNHRATFRHILTTKPEFLLTESRLWWSNLFPWKYLWNLACLRPVELACVGLPSQSGRRDLEWTYHTPPMFVTSRSRLFRLLSLVKMFGNVSLHCLGFVTPRGS